MKAMKIIPILFLITCGCFAQSNNPAYESFKKEMEAYQSNPANTKLKPGNCKDYVLKYTVRGEDFSEIAVPSNARTLCEDLARFDQSKNPNPDGTWTYDIKAIGDKYYSIRADKNVGSVVQEFYYYQRK
jgi:hypothetical protein